MAFETAINTSLLTTYLIKKFIPTLEAELQFQKFTTKAIIPPGQGKIGRFNVFSNPPGTTTAISEGGDFIHDPNTLNKITTLTTTGTDVTITEYGEYVKVTDLQELTQVSTAREELANRMAFGGALCIDTLVRAAAAGVAATQAFSASATSTASGVYLAAGTVKPTYMNLASLMGAGAKLRDISSTGCRGFTGVSGHPDGALAAILTPRAEVDMVTEGTTGKITWGQAVTNVPGAMGQTRWVKGYMGESYGIAAYRTQNYQQLTVTSLCDVNYVLGEGGLGAVALKDMKATVIINEINSPYKNSNSVAWHAYFGTAVTAATRVIRLYTLAV